MSRDYRRAGGGAEDFFFSHGSFNTFLLLAIINHPTSSDLLGPRTRLYLPLPPLKRRDKKGLFHRKVIPPMWLLYLMFLEALIISLMRGTPRVMFMEATPAKWKVLRVIWVPGSPMLWAQRAPTAEPGSIWALCGRCRQELKKSLNPTFTIWFCPLSFYFRHMLRINWLLCLNLLFLWAAKKLEDLKTD